MEVKITREPQRPLVFDDLSPGDVFGFRENPIIAIVLDPLDRNSKDNAVVINQMDTTGDVRNGRMVTVPLDREVVRVKRLNVTLEN